MTSSKIEWTDATWNPVTGCSKVSPGCDNCYMFTLYPRLRAMAVPGYDLAPDRVQIMRERLFMPLSWKKPRWVFVNSMADLFHPKVPFEFISEVFLVMQEAAEAQDHKFQVLTKRPGLAAAGWQSAQRLFPNGWPQNVWMGTSVENQKYAPRLTVLARLPANVRFVSAEPLLGPVDLSPWLSKGELDWIIVGGESGARARPMELDWARQIRDQALKADVPFFLKQLGGKMGKRSGAEAILDGCSWNDYPE